MKPGELLKLLYDESPIGKCEICGREYKEMLLMPKSKSDPRICCFKCSMKTPAWDKFVGKNE